MNETVVQDNPYAAPAAMVADENPGELALADRGTRLGAVFLDGLFFGFSMAPLILVMSLLGPETTNLDAKLGLGMGVALLVFAGVVIGNCYYLHRNGQTLAKKLLGIRVVRRDGSRCGLARIFFARYLPVTVLGLIPFIGGIVSLVDALLIFRDDRRCLHDEIADTIVVRA